MKALLLSFYNVDVKVETGIQEIPTLLRKDFSKFVVEEIKDKAFFTLHIHFSTVPNEKIPQVVSSMQTLNSICYDIDNTRYCDYYGDLLVILDKKTNVAHMYSKNISKIHEVSYLLILSIVGKKMDLMGLHKLHAFSVSYKDLALVCMMPMRGGKSTLLMEFLKDSRFKIISDDIPLINSIGEVLPFPMKIGLSSVPNKLDVTNPEENLYTMDRAQYGKKQLLSLEGLPGRAETLDRKFKKVILIEAFRYNAETSIIKESGFFESGKGVLKHGVIGFGLPMVMEYFWENGLRDFLTKTQIFFFRSFAFTSLLFRAKRMKLFLGKNPGNASEVLIKYVINNYDKI